MGLFKRIKHTVRRVENFGRRAVGKENIGTRSDAADEMLKAAPVKKPVDISRQAGSGQIKYTGETLE